MMIGLLVPINAQVAPAEIMTPYAPSAACACVAIVANHFFSSSRTRSYAPVAAARRYLRAEGMGPSVNLQGPGLMIIG